MLRSLYDYLDPRVTDLPADDRFLLSAVRTWVFATCHGHDGHTMLRGGFRARGLEGATLAFLCAMALLDRHGYGTMFFRLARDQRVSDDEARILTLFAAGRVNDSRLGGIAATLVTEDMAAQLHGAAAMIGRTMMTVEPRDTGRLMP